MNFLTLAQAAAKSGYSVQHLRRLAKARKVEHHERGRYYFFTEEQVAKLMPTHVVLAEAPAAKSETEKPKVDGAPF